MRIEVPIKTVGEVILFINQKFGKKFESSTDGWFSPDFVQAIAPDFERAKILAQISWNKKNLNIWKISVWQI